MPLRCHRIHVYHIDQSDTPHPVTLSSKIPRIHICQHARSSHIAGKTIASVYARYRATRSEMLNERTVRTVLSFHVDLVNPMEGDKTGSSHEPFAHSSICIVLDSVKRTDSSFPRSIIYPPPSTHKVLPRESPITYVCTILKLPSRTVHAYRGSTAPASYLT